MPVILGGGIGGLSAAYYLTKIKPSSTVTLIESSKRLGGWIKSKSYDNFLFEVGPHTIRSSGHAGLNTLKLVEEVNLENKIVPILSTHSAAKNRMIYVNNELHLLPTDLKSMFKTTPPFTKPLYSAIYNDVFKSRPKESMKDESIYDFTERRFGKEIAEYLISSIVCGICAGDAKEISVNFLMKDLYKYEKKFGSAVLGMVMSNLFSFSDKAVSALGDFPLSKRANTEKWTAYSFDGGLEIFPKKLANVLSERGVNISLETECKNITITDDNQVKLMLDDGKELLTDYIISSLPSYRLSKLIKHQHSELASVLKQIPFVNVCVVNLQYNRSDILNHNGFGFLVPPCENLPILGVIFDSCSFDMKENTVLTVMMGGRWFDDYFGPEPAEQELLDIAVRHVKKILKIKKKPNMARVQISKKCIPQYTVGHLERVEWIRDYIAKNKLPIGLCGFSYDGVGINDVILSSQNLINALHNN